MAYTHSKKHEQNLAEIRKRVDEMEAETAWLVKHRFKIWLALIVFWSLVFWVIFK